MDANEKVVCSNCIGDEYLQGLIEDNGIDGECSYCTSKGKCVPLSVVGNPVASILNDRLTPALKEEYYDVNSEALEYSHDGVLLDEIISVTAVIDSEELASDLADFVESSLFDERIIKEGGSCIDRDDYYKVAIDGIDSLVSRWNTYSNGVKTEYRFYPKDDPLPELLKAIEEVRTSSDQQPVKILKQNDGVSLFRGRLVDSDSDIKKAFEDPLSFFSSPPSDKATTGRMNPPGIGLLYCAFSPKTCIAELKPSVGSLVVTAEFQLKRDIRVLDTTIFKSLKDFSLGFYGPDFLQRIANLRFLQHLNDAISLPVQKSDCDREYIPTQAIAEYLAAKYQPPIDGVIYSSSLGTGLEDNVVLFRRARRIEGTNPLLNYDESVKCFYNDELRRFFYRTEPPWNTRNEQTADEKDRQANVEQICDHLLPVTVSLVGNSVVLHKVTELKLEFITYELES